MKIRHTRRLNEYAVNRPMIEIVDRHSHRTFQTLDALVHTYDLADSMSIMSTCDQERRLIVRDSVDSRETASTSIYPKSVFN